MRTFFKNSNFEYFLENKLPPKSFEHMFLKTLNNFPFNSKSFKRKKLKKSKNHKFISVYIFGPGFCFRTKTKIYDYHWIFYMQKPYSAIFQLKTFKNIKI